MLNTTTICCLVESKTPGYLVRELPPLGIHDVHVRTLAGAISIGAELPQWLEQDMTETSYDYPLETGYESYGEVLAVGDAVQIVKPGDRVVSFYGHQDQAIVPESKVIPVPAHISPREALLLILSCDAAKGVRKLTLTPDTSVLVSGMGTIGLLTVHYLRHYVNVRQIDILEPLTSRAELARQLGARVVTPGSSMYDAAIECSGRQAAFAELQSAVRPHGAICVLSDGNRESLTLTPAFHAKELQIVASSDGWDYRKHADWLFADERHATLSALFEHETSFSKLASCFASLMETPDLPIKVFVDYEQTS
ncbi:MULTISPECIES: zinc-dependent alcohol dehydrogenase [Exiguobacterium]|uniref:zinc-dependent alcohol dehydrogenase n=1 Tax=Exiguobacterium sp. UBA1053 TaxID=1946487 RepID=UPI0025C38098|nr:MULTISPECIES: zinc-binding alcohol dehydrogenase [Exiguobacterium]